MRVSVTKERVKKSKYVREDKIKLILQLIPNKNNEREKKVVRAMAMALVEGRPYIGTGPLIKGIKSEVYFDVRPIPAIKKGEYPTDQTAIDMKLPWNTAPEVIANLRAEAKLQEEQEYQRTRRAENLAKQLGIKLPKKLPKFSCLCGATFGARSKSKYLRHKKLCAVAREAEPVIELAKKVSEKLRESQTRKVKKSKVEKPKAQRIPDKAPRKQRTRKKAAKKIRS